MANGKTINELPDVGDLTGEEMLPVSSYVDGEYKTYSTTVDNIVSKVNVDEKIKDFVYKSDLNSTLESYVSNESLNTKLESYVSNESLNTKLESYVSNETLKDYPTISVVNDMIVSSNDVIMENVNKKMKEAGHITRDEAIAIAEDYVASYNTFKINGMDEIKMGTTALSIEGNNSGDIDWYTNCGNIDDSGNLTLKRLNWVDYEIDLQTMTDVAIHATDKKTGKTTFSHNEYLSDKVWNFETATIKGEDLVVALNTKWQINTTGDMIAYNIGTTYNNEGVCGLSRENILCYSATATTNYQYRNNGIIYNVNVGNAEKKFMASYACMLLPVSWTYVDIYNPSTEVRLWATPMRYDGRSYNEVQSYNGNTVTICLYNNAYWSQGNPDHGGKQVPIHLLLRIESVNGQAMQQPVDLSGITITVR